MHIALIPPQDPAQLRTWFPAGDIDLDYAAASEEGWTVSEAETGVQLQRVDSPALGQPAFADDRNDWTHVVRHARESSPLHRHALALIDDVEHCLIEGLHGFW